MQSNTQFWLVNTAGWFIFLLSSGIFFAYLSGNVTWHTLLIQSFAFAYYLPATGLLRKWINQLGWFTNNKATRLIPLLILITLGLALFGQFLVSLFMMYVLNIMSWQAYSIPVLLVTTGQNWIVLCLWTTLYLMLKQVRNNRQQQLKQIQLESALQATELKALKAQLNPHFIFNCLNNMRALALDDGPKTREMITNLSEILKYAFQFSDHTEVTVEREVQHVKNYLALEKIQFEDRLSFAFDCDDEILQHTIPTLSIQLLVENAIKHGIMGLPDGGQIEIKVKKQAPHMVIEVINTGSLSTQTSTNTIGVGLKNLQKRLQLAYQNDASFQLKAINPEKVSATITLPLETRQ